MKISKTLPIFAILALFLSSCGSLSISQKRYSRGLNFDWFASKDGNANDNQKATKKPRKEAQKVAEDNNTTSYVAETQPEEATEENYAGNTQRTSATSTPAVIKENTKSNNSTKSKRVRKPLSIVKELKKEIKAASHKKTIAASSPNSSDESNDSDVNLILLVILAILLAPLAVYLYFGELNVHFWISILLFFLGGGLFLASGGGYIGLAIIHALLVVFGVFG